MVEVAGMYEYDISELLLLEKQTDFIISCISFEERCAAVCKNIKEQGRIRKIILYKNTDAGESGGYDGSGCVKAINEQQETIVSHLSEKHISHVIIEGKHRNLNIKLNAIIEIIDTIRTEMGQAEQPPVIGLDVTCFTRIDLIVLLDYLFDFFPEAIVKIIYVRPKEHDAEWLTKGYSAIDSIVGFSGRYDYLKRDLLVVMSGFEKERPQNYIEAYEPDKIMFGSSYSHPTKPPFGNRTKAVVDYFRSQNENAIGFDFSAVSVRDCLYDLERSVAPELEDCNIIIAPLCTKLSVVATFLFAKKHPEIQLAYCYPKEYNWKNFSTGMEKFYLYEIKRDWL